MNPHFKSRYADLADIVKTVLPVLNSHGLCLWHSMPDANTMRTTITHGESMTEISCDVPLIVDKQNMQGMKSATTYAKRIGAESVTGIAAEDDDGNNAAASPPKATPPKPIPQNDYVPQGVVLKLWKEARDIGWKDDDIKDLIQNKVKAKSSSQLTSGQLELFRTLLLQDGAEKTND